MSAVPIYIHIENVDGNHTVSPATLLVLTDVYEDILEFFDVKASLQIGVPQKGCWEVNIWAIITAIGISPIAAFLTGKSAEEWALLGREALIDLCNQLITKPVALFPADTPQEFYRKRNKLYEQLNSDENISEITIGQTCPVPRQEFPLYIAQLTDEEPVYLGEIELLVSSPDWKGKRSWRGRIVGSDEKMSSFTFNRQSTRNFWRRVEQNDLIISTTEDVMKVQLALHPSDKVKKCIIRVLSYNEEVIDPPLSDSYIYEIYGDRKIEEKDSSAQLSIFDIEK